MERLKKDNTDLESEREELKKKIKEGFADDL